MASRRRRQLVLTLGIFGSSKYLATEQYLYYLLRFRVNFVAAHRYVRIDGDRRSNPSIIAAVHFILLLLLFGKNKSSWCCLFWQKKLQTNSTENGHKKLHKVYIFKFSKYHKIGPFPSLLASYFGSRMSQIRIMLI